MVEEKFLSNMKRVHLFPAHRFSKTAILFFKYKFPEYHFDCFVLSQPNDEEYKYLDGAVSFVSHSLREEFFYLKRILKQYDIVYIHSLFLPTKVKIIFGILHPNLVRKLAWIDWGYDLYRDIKVGSNWWVKKVVRLIEDVIFSRRIPFFIGIHPVDLLAYQKEIRGSAQLLYAPYRFGEKTDDYLLNYTPIPLGEKLKTGNPFTIQVGHRAMRDLHHMSILDKLQKYKDENIQIVLPLSYGDQQYADEVTNYAISLFGTKVTVLHELLPPKEYREYLSSIDALIIDSKRQIALGNIHMMFYMCKKVFMPADSLLSTFFVDNGVKIYDINEIGSISFEELTAEDDLKAEREFIMKFDSKNPVLIWKDVFDCIC